MYTPGEVWVRDEEFAFSHFDTNENLVDAPHIHVIAPNDDKNVIQVP